MFPTYVTQILAILPMGFYPNHILLISKLQHYFIYLDFFNGTTVLDIDCIERPSVFQVQTKQTKRGRQDAGRYCS